MPWDKQAMKDVQICDKQREVDKKHQSVDLRMRKLSIMKVMLLLNEFIV